MRTDVYQRITDKIVQDLEQGVRPWMQPWSAEHAAGRIVRPRRFNGLPYNGINVLMLWSAADEKGYASPVWMTFKQALEFNAHVRKGETGSLVVYADKITRTETDATTGEEAERAIPFMKGYTVFNVEQIDGLPEQFYAKPEPKGESVPRIERAESFFSATGADIRHGGARAYYSISTNHVQMPPFESFRDAESYYATLAHEATHWTRHPSQDRQTSLEVFGGYVHTYKFSEGVEDGVVLDLVYEARDIDQELGSEAKIDAWFEAKTKGLNDWQKDELKKKWGTMQHVLSSKSRMDRVVSDIIFDFNVKPRLSSDRGNAILVASSIYDACKYFSLFQKTLFKGKCAVVTSYNPLAKDITLEETGANTETDKQFIYNTYTELLKDAEAKPGMTKTETYEEHAKSLFTKEPANMKLLVVVDKLLTGFDAPPCTYLYIDKSMQDHGLFQAICRTNRLDGDDKDFGYIVDYKDLFKKLVNKEGTGALQVLSTTTVSDGAVLP